MHALLDKISLQIFKFYAHEILKKYLLKARYKKFQIEVNIFILLFHLFHKNIPTALSLFYSNNLSQIFS